MKQNNHKIRHRLEYLRGELRAEKISYAEIAELQSLAEYIKPGDVELLEAAGVPEFKKEHGKDCMCIDCIFDRNLCQQCKKESAFLSDVCMKCAKKNHREAMK